MANEIVAPAGTGLVLYAVVRDAGARPWNTGTSALETYTESHWANYAVSLAEQGTCGLYVGSFPSALVAAGLYTVDVRQRGGGTPQASDRNIGTGALAWTGSAEAFVLADSAGRPSVTVNGYASGQDPASYVLQSAANKLATNGSGQVQHDLTQAVPTSNTAQTVGDALCGARAQAFGAWHLNGTSLILYAPDGTTPVRTFILDNALNPTQRV